MHTRQPHTDTAMFGENHWPIDILSLKGHQFSIWNKPIKTLLQLWNSYRLWKNYFGAPLSHYMVRKLNWLTSNYLRECCKFGEPFQDSLLYSQNVWPVFYQATFCCTILQVRLGIYVGRQEVKHIIFSGEGTTYDSWLSMSKLMSSSWSGLNDGSNPLGVEWYWEYQKPQ